MPCRVLSGPGGCDVDVIARNYRRVFDARHLTSGVSRARPNRINILHSYVYEIRPRPLDFPALITSFLPAVTMTFQSSVKSCLKSDLAVCRNRCVVAELSMGPFCVTQPNPWTTLRCSAISVTYLQFWQQQQQRQQQEWVSEWVDLYSA